MNEQTLVAVYNTAAQADAAVRDLRAANVPADAISQHAKRGSLQGSAGTDMAPAREQGFWASLFGGERLAEYHFSFAETDRKLIAVEYADFAGAIRGEHPPEVDAAQGARSVAISYALLESSALGRPVTVAEVLAEQVGDYQRSIDVGMGLTFPEA